ncbi:magnesium transporter 4 [Artemisia annua]|uniref:Magnesium transporter n=1 Tax=Artemisia annua TaxID=35608 RepID=A0A2U1P5J2_ARTAN|nr:magnesium transporter 4 [Artemisia annua]
MAIIIERYNEKVLALPRNEIDTNLYLCKYQNFWYHHGFWLHSNANFSVEAIMASQDEFQALPTDVFLASQVKSGTTWLKSLGFAILNRAKFKIDKDSCAIHPLITTSPHDCVPFLESESFLNNPSYANGLMATHIPYTSLPQSIISSDCRIVYIHRNPKDVLISFWHFMNTLREDGSSPTKIDDTFELFRKGYYKASLERPNNILFLTYEKLKEDTYNEVKRLANFIGSSLTKEEEDDGSVQEIIELCSFKKLSEAHKGNKDGSQSSNGIYFRKGIVGDSVNYLTTEMIKTLDVITKEKFDEMILTSCLYLMEETSDQRVGADTDWTHLYDLGELRSREASPSRSAVNIPERDVGDQGVKADGKHSFDKRDGPMLLPFEFVALEACLEAACSSLDNEARTLEQEAHPALDKLTSKISTLNLERVRQIKSRLVAITGRVQKVRDELEQLLDDDEDMAEMYLTDKLEQQLEKSSTSSFVNEEDAMDEEILQTEADGRILAGGITDGTGNGKGNRNIHELGIQQMDNQPEHLFRANTFGRDSHMTRTSTTVSNSTKRLDIEELEMLLEAYFVQIDGTLNKLSTLREYVDDTEDYINIMLDDKQNHLLQMGVMLTTATLVVSAFVVVAGVFGMNITIDLFDKETEEQREVGMRKFLWTIGGGTTGSIFLYVVAMVWCKSKRLLE